MCKTKLAVDAVQPTTPSTRHSNHKQPSSSVSPPMRNNRYAASSSTTTTTYTSSSTSRSSHALPSLRGSLPENPHLYDISELRKATNNFLSGNFTSNTASSSSTRCWRCSLSGKDVIIFQRKSHNIHALRPQIIRQKISSICKSHHIAIVNLLGASISGEYVYLVYEFINGGSNLYDLLHNKNNPDFTVLDSWMSRMQIAADLADGVAYIHNDSGLNENCVHNHLKSSSVIVTEPSFNAKICHFGTAMLCGEPIQDRENHQFDSNDDHNDNDDYNKVEEISSVDQETKATSTSKKLARSHSVRFTGTTGYMSPEFQITGLGTKESDVYAFGVILVELLSGEESVKYKYNKATKDYMKISAVNAARAVVEDGEGEREWRLRKWVDRRLKDSYPVEVAYKMVKLAVDCLHVDPDKRPNMQRVAGKISKLYLESKAWCDKMKIPTEFTVSFAPR